MGGKLTTTDNIGQFIFFWFFAFLRFCTFVKIFHVRLWKKKGKILVFTGVCVCVRAKLTLVSFFLSFFLHLSLKPFSVKLGNEERECPGDVGHLLRELLSFALILFQKI